MNAPREIRSLCRSSVWMAMALTPAQPLTADTPYLTDDTFINHGRMRQDETGQALATHGFAACTPYSHASRPTALNGPMVQVETVNTSCGQVARFMSDHRSGFYAWIRDVAQSGTARGDLLMTLTGISGEIAKVAYGGACPIRYRFPSWVDDQAPTTLEESFVPQPNDRSVPP